MSAAELEGSLPNRLALFCSSTDQDLWTSFLLPRLTHIQAVSPRDHPDVVQLACQKLDDEVAILLAAVCALRTRRNALSRISTLPPEVLGRVFHFHAANDPPDENHLGWIRATHVCRFWRETALQNPSLWSSVTGRLGQKWMQEMLLRTKSVSLIWYSQCSSTTRIPPNNTVAGYGIPEQLSRIRHLSITEPTRAMNTVLNSLMTSPAPILESLDLADPNPVISEERVVLCDIFNTQAPMLRRLQLRCLQLSWSAPLLRGLVYLHIDNQDDPRREPATDDVTGYNQFFSALREMSALETLFLSHCLPVKPGDPPKIQTVMLPHVKKLTLGGGLPVECKNIIKHLAMAPLCDVTIECEELGPRPSESTFSFVKAHTLSFANQQPLLAMFLSTTQGRHSFYDPKWQLRFWPAGSAADLANLRRDRGGVPSISILVDRLRDDFHHSVKDLSECIQKDIIRDLIIESDGVLDWTLTYEDWLDIFEDYMEVENISVRGDVARTLCATLDTSTSYPMDWERLLYGEDGSELCESQMRLFFAKLKRIEFKQVDFNGLSETDRLFEHNENGGGYRTISTSVYNILKSSLSHRRRQSDIPLTLFIRQCSIDADQIRGLEEIAEVSWDVIEDPSNEDESGKD